MRTVIRYFICIVLILVGIFCSIKLSKEINEASYVNGSIDIENEFRKESFFYSSTAIAFYPTSNSSSYMFSSELPAVDGIDGDKNDYSFYFMDMEHEILNAEIQAGRVVAPISINFYNPDGSLACKGKITIKIEFLSGCTNLTLTCASKSSADYFEQYFADYGIKLKLVENVGGQING